MDLFFFDEYRLGALAATSSAAYRSARPFPHVVIDDFLPNRVVDTVIDEFPGPGDAPWQHFDAEQEVKLATEHTHGIPPFTRHVLDQFNSEAMITFLERLTGIRDKLSAMTEVASRYGCKIVGVTLGSEGSHLLCDGVFIDTPAFDVPGGCVDTTGAGDAFRAGLLYGLLSGSSVEEAARSANAVAALKCRDLGARTALPTEDEVTTLLKIS